MVRLCTDLASSLQCGKFDDIQREGMFEVGGDPISLEQVLQRASLGRMPHSFDTWEEGKILKELLYETKSQNFTTEVYVDYIGGYEMLYQRGIRGFFDGNTEMCHFVCGRNQMSDPTSGTLVSFGFPYEIVAAAMVTNEWSALKVRLLLKRVEI